MNGCLIAVSLLIEINATPVFTPVPVQRDLITRMEPVGGAWTLLHVKGSKGRPMIAGQSIASIRKLPCKVPLGE